jgi:chromosome segregation protein
MYLSSIDLFGFKSFAKRTRIDIAPGVTAIVGPNGCGKTNIVDAVRWVLGEQRESALRSERMDNVIFGGSVKKRPLGMAEISLTLQDTDGTLPIDYDEITITRRLFRSGKSEYLLNKSVCRLKDLVSLFMDTGIGSDSYSIIELKMVEDIISENPDEIRRLLDEATGITRYKVRRKEALRRLIDARQDRERVLDILAEVEKQANGLKRQVAKVRLYRRLENRTRKIRSSIILNRVRQAEKSLLPIDSSLSDLQVRNEKTSAELSSFEAEALRLDGELMKLESDRQELVRNYHEAQQQYQETVGEKSRIEEDIRLSKWRLDNNVEETTKNRETLKQVEEEILDAKEELERNSTGLPDLEGKLSERGKSFEEADERFRAQRSESMRTQESLNTLREREAGAIRSSEERKASIRAMRVRADELIRRRAELDEDLKRKTAELEEVDRELENHSRTLNDLQRRKDDLAGNIEELQERLRKRESDLDSAEGREDKLALQIEHFKELHRRSSPLYSAGGALAQRFPDLISATLGDELQVAEKYIKAVESALQGMSYFRVVEDAVSFKTLLEAIGNESGGRAALLLGEAPTFELRNIRAFAEKTNGIALADQVEKTGMTSDWIRYYLRNTAVYERIDELRSASSFSADEGMSLVTLAGEFTDGQGLWIIGSTGEDPPRAIGVSTRLKELAGELQSIEKEKQNIAEELPKLRDELNALELEYQAADKTVQESRQALDQETVRKLKLEAQTVSAHSLVEQLSDEIEQLPGKIEKLSSAEEAQEEELSSVLGKLRSLEADLRGYQDAEAQTLEERESARQALADIELQVERTRAHIDRFRDRVTDLENRSQRLNVRFEVLSGEKESYLATQMTLSRDLERQQERVTESGASMNEQRAKVDETDAQRLTLQEEHRAAGSRVRDLRAILEEASQSMHRLQLEKVEIETTLKEERSQLDGLDLEKISEEPPDADLLDDLERKMRAAEPLNLAAEQEYVEQKQRLDFLNEQINDLKEAESSLEQTVVTLNVEARERFDTSFVQIRENFQEIFREIFKGGDADLTLTDDDSLESRIEILASPGNKRVGSLSLLSGGEKALTAISLLFAIYMEKPSPFCILDEVDAPLDDENTGRFNQLLEKFTPKTQFLVVTHNKRTMEVARNLLGVTMEEDGISKVVPVQIS